jgi:hypothetical protein
VISPQHSIASFRIGKEFGYQRQGEDQTAFRHGWVRLGVALVLPCKVRAQGVCLKAYDGRLPVPIVNREASKRTGDFSKMSFRASSKRVRVIIQI